VEESDDGSFELGALLGPDCDGREAAPEDVLADVGCDEERDARAEAVALLEQLVEKDHDHTRGEELEEDKDGVEGSEVGEFTVHAREEVGKGFSQGNDQPEELLGCLEEVTVFLGVLVDFDDFGASEELHDHA
jgi:hypothetical protein